ncbi:hypothetical protein SDC9_120641 [bioreactor metagenome]|uniref:Uncharacterized protein n=1 Tax=bioreactor metagenome TaxID=1076179 RepID=A0A645C7M8_9ZZZZ
MHIADAGACKGRPAIERRKLHVEPRGEVRSVLIYGFKVFKDELYRFNGELIRALWRKKIGVCFNGMRQRVHARRARDMRRQADREFRIQHRIAWN